MKTYFRFIVVTSFIVSADPENKKLFLAQQSCRKKEIVMSLIELSNIGSTLTMMMTSRAQVSCSTCYEESLFEDILYDDDDLVFKDILYDDID